MTTFNNDEYNRRRREKRKAAKIRWNVLNRDKWKCHYCKRYGDTIDHVHPLSKGGSTTYENCVCACLKCNRAKGNMSYREFVNLRIRA